MSIDKIGIVATRLNTRPVRKRLLPLTSYTGTGLVRIDGVLTMVFNGTLSVVHRGEKVLCVRRGNRWYAMFRTRALSEADIDARCPSPEYRDCYILDKPATS